MMSAYITDMTMLRTFAGYSTGICKGMELPPDTNGFIITVLSGETRMNFVVQNPKWRASFQKHRGPIVVEFSAIMTAAEGITGSTRWLRLDKAK